MMAASDAVRTDIRERAGRLEAAADLHPLVERARSRRFIAIGEASHGTHEFYSWRAELTRQLIVAGRCTWIGVEGDWPDCWRIDRWVRGFESAELDARAVLASFQRWPTWMWANAEVADFLDWLHDHNRRVPAGCPNTHTHGRSVPTVGSARRAQLPSPAMIPPPYLHR